MTEKIIKKHKQGRKIPRWLNPDEIKTIFNAAKDENYRDYMILQTIYFMGLRNREVRKLKDENIDFKERMVTLVQSKNKKDRIVTIPNISEYIEELDKWVKKNPGFIFKGTDNGKIQERAIQRMVKKYATLAEIHKPKEIHPHTLRHSFATLLYNKTNDLRLVQEHLGHSRLDTSAIYAHMGKDTLRKRVDEAYEDW